MTMGRRYCQLTIFLRSSTSFFMSPGTLSHFFLHKSKDKVVKIVRMVLPVHSNSLHRDVLLKRSRQFFEYG
jgi:hypothetical protein